MPRFGFCSECGDRFDRQSNAQRYCLYCAGQKHREQCQSYRDRTKDCKLVAKPPVGSETTVDWLALEWEIYHSIKRSVATMRADDELLADGRCFRHQAVLFPEADYAQRDVSVVPRTS